MYQVVVFLVRIAMKLWYDLKIEGRENIPKKGNFVYASNHRSYADPVLVVIGGRGRYAFMAKSELFQNPIFGWLIRSLGAFPVERGTGDMEALNRAVSTVEKGENLLIFPEGTRSLDGRVGRGKPGVALIAARAKADVIPVGISFEGKLHFRSRIIVRYGAPIAAARLSVDETASERELLRSLRRNVMPPIMDGIRSLVDEPAKPELPAPEEIRETQKTE